MSNHKFIEKIRLSILTVLLYTLTFEEALEFSALPFLYGFYSLCAMAAVPLFFFDTVRKLIKKSCLTNNYIAVAAGIVYAVSGLIGYSHYHYQSLSNTLISIFDTMRFWLLIFFFYKLFKGFNIEKYASHIVTHVEVISVFMTAAVIADMIFHIWPRQVHRFGLGSIQIFYQHPTNLAVHCLFLLCMLCLLTRFYKRTFFFMPLMLFNLFMTLRLRILGLVAVFIMMVIFFVLFDWKLTWVNGTAMAGGAFLIGGKRFIRYYTSPEALTMARGQFAYNGWKIAVAEFPFGAGNGTFGSRVAQRFYSPLYYKYNMYRTAGMDPIWPAYACDTFWPMIMGETGFLGLAAYLVMVGWLFLKVQRLRARSVWIYLAAMTAVAYEMLETTGALAFSDVTAVSIAFVFGLIFGMEYTQESSEFLKGAFRIKNRTENTVNEVDEGSRLEGAETYEV